ncbi:hypothetical protein JQC67_14335 [Aurantibacter crassamenti]|uniref:hypothetical protein n=1 Tax=Aurantibacter crassamenti TaxID=1837375 RepID=UPI00193950FA|nr:hypothetical protein [Aurantibacter crassamenti]MBM1107329.1 hypothetical protein [Aurantibacter crassamenti]
MINKQLIIKTEQTEWDFGNEILYKMCQQNFEHKRIDIIVGKVILIGRAYAAAIERRKNKTEENNNFYIDKVAPMIKNSKLDVFIGELKLETEVNEKNIADILKLHLYLTELIKEITEQNKRSFCSKYLHFHLPNLFFIYDTRAVKGIRLLKTKLPRKHKTELGANGIDKEYATFFYKCYEQKKLLEKEYSGMLSIRHFDNILMKVVEFRAEKSTRKYKYKT